MGAECRTCTETILTSRNTEASLPIASEFYKNSFDPNSFYSPKTR